MRNLKKLTILLLLTGWVTGLTAQTEQPSDTLPAVWNLQTCIDYALQHNITLQKSRISAESADIDVKTARSSFLPIVQGNISQRIVNRPYSTSGTLINGDNITTSQSKTSYNGSYGIDLNWTLYNGQKRINTLKQQNLNKRIADLEVANNANTIEESITQTYIQILYASEAIRINESTLSVSQAEAERGAALLAAGSISRADQAQLEAQVSNDRYQLVAAQATLADYKLQLKQLLELDGDAEMQLDLPTPDDGTLLAPLPAKNDVYSQALTLRPEVEASQLQVKTAELNTRIARNGYLPTVSLSAGIGSSNANGSDFTFGEQIKQNWNNSLGVTLSIPIFNQRQTKSSIQKAKLQEQTSRLDLQEKQKELYKTIENLWLEANSAQQRYVAANEKLHSSQTSYDLLSEQFNLGMKNTVELLTEKSNLLQAHQETLQAKYTALLNITLLNFYGGKTISIE